MMFLRSIITASVLLLLFTSCSERQKYQEYSYTIDSLQGAVITAEEQLRLSDSAELRVLANKYHTYRRYIERNFRDTLSIQEAQQLQDFELAGQYIEVFANNRKALYKRAALQKEQLEKLNADVKSEAIDLRGLETVLKEEKEQAHAYTELVDRELNELNDAVVRFKRSLPEVKDLIRRRNMGVLPAALTEPDAE